MRSSNFFGLKTLTNTVKNFRISTSSIKAVGKAPGDLTFIGERKQDFIKISLFAYNDNVLEEIQYQTFNEINLKDFEELTVWINIDGIHDVEFLKTIRDFFKLNALVMEDVAGTNQRPKFEEIENGLFYILKMLKTSKPIKRIEEEQVSMIQKGNLLITFQEQVGDVFGPVRNRIRNKSGRIRQRGVDYLAFALTDFIIDNYSVIVENIADDIEQIEQDILIDSNKHILELINTYSLTLTYLRKSVRPTRSLIDNWKNSESEIISEDLDPFLSDLSDTIERVYENIELYKTMLSEQLMIYNTLVSNKLNDIMKMLTMFSAIFIPLSFIAGIYGTNFEYIPEFSYKYAYFIMLGLMVSIASSMIIYFKRKKWF